jgi:hypothetical protein
MSDPKSEKPYKLESIPRPWTETDVETWWLTVMDFLKSVTRYKKSMNEDKEWKPKRFPNRGFTGTQAADRSDLIDSILLKIAKNDSEQIHKLRICQECSSKGPETNSSSTSVSRTASTSARTTSTATTGI